MDIGSIQSPLSSGIVRDTSRTAPADTQPQKKAADVGQAKSGAERISAKAAADDRPKEISREQVEEAVATIQEFVQTVRRSINFAVDDGSGHVVVKVTDAGSGDVIRQIPSEEALKLAENLSEVRSLLFKAEA